LSLNSVSYLPITCAYPVKPGLTSVLYLNSGNYIDCEGFEDYHLWVRMIIEGCKTTNIKDNLVYARTGNDMMGRRGGVSYIAKEIHFQKELFRLGFINRKVLLCNCSQRALVRLLPKVVREVIYKRLLRR